MGFLNVILFGYFLHWNEPSEVLWIYFCTTANFSKGMGLAETWVEFLCRLEEGLTIRAGFGLVMSEGENVSIFLGNSKE